jgi:hypothetical protein
LAQNRSASPYRFEPRQTEQIQRRTQMPGVEDFPAVGQRDYYAKQSAPDPFTEKTESQEPQRRPGLFERLAGLGRRQSDSLHEPDTGNSEDVTLRNTAEGQAPDSHHLNNSQSAHKAPEVRDQPIENNDFYGREKQRR